METIYNLSLSPVDQKIAPGVVGGSAFYMMPGGVPYLDRFGRTHAPAAREIIGECMGVAWSCSNLNAQSMSSLKIRLYLRTRKGDRRKHRYVEAHERQIGPCSRVIDPAKHVRHPLVKRCRHGFEKVGGSPVVGFGSDEETVISEITDHPLLRLLDTPEPVGDDVSLIGSSHRWATHMFLQALGRAYWLLDEYEMGVPTKLWLLHSQWVREIPDPKGIRFVDSYEYGIGADKTTFTPDQIIAFRHNDIGHLRMGGFSRFMAAMEAQQLLRLDDAHLNSLLQNGGFPIAAFVPKGDDTGQAFITPEMAQKARKAFVREFAQAGTGGIAVLPWAGALQSLSFKPTEMMDEKRREQLIQTVANCFGVPMSLLKLNESNLTSADAASYQYAKYTLMPEAILFEGMLNTHIKPLFPGTEDMFLAFDNPVPDDKAFEMEMSRTAWEQGLLTVNEARRAFEKPPLEGEQGEMRYLGRGLAPIGPDGRPLPTPQDMKKNPDADPNDTGVSDHLMDGGSKPKKPKKSNGTRKILARLTEAVELLAKNGNSADIQREVQRAGMSIEMHSQPHASDMALSTRPDGDMLGIPSRGRKILPSMWPASAAMEMTSRLAAEGYAPEEIEAALKGSNHAVPADL